MKPFERGMLTITLALAVAALAIAMRKGTAVPEPPESREPDGGRRESEGTGERAPRPSHSPELARLERRLEALAARLEALEKRTGESTAGAVPEATEEERKERDALAAAAMDPAGNPAGRVAALKQLRRKAPWLRDGAVAASMLELMRVTEDALLRADIVRNLYGVKEAAVKEELLSRLKGDVDESVRRESAECLELMQDDPAVVGALEWARDRDVDEGVRTQAAESLAKKIGK